MTSIALSEINCRLRKRWRGLRCDVALTIHCLGFQEDIYAALRGQVTKNFDFAAHKDVNVGSRLYTRCERETLMRLPNSGAVLFTIRTYIRPLTVFESRPMLAQQMVRAVETLPQSITKYKTMGGFYDVALQYLRACASRPVES